MAIFKHSSDKNQLFTTGIILLLMALVTVSAAVYSVIRAVRYSTGYGTDVTGTVISSTVFYETDDFGNGSRIPYSTIKVGYETPEGRQRTLERKHLTGEYKEGEAVALRCTEDYQNAVLESETHQQPLFLIAMFILTMFFSGTGLLLVKGRGRM